MDNKNNSGDRNSGNRNSGDRNSGNRNSGDRNSGNSNSGYWNSGDSNSGNWNSGYLNSGNWNSGNWNSGNSNSGYLNSDEPPMRVCNVFCDVTMTEYEATHGAPNIRPILTEWIDSKDMTDAEKKRFPDHANLTGCLRTHEYKDAFKAAWNKASDTDKKWFTDLPNFNPEIFFEIAGVDLRTNAEPSLSGQKVSVTMPNGKTYTATID